MEDFSGEAFVAFADLCGFKKLAEDRRRRAAEALDLLYNTSYRLLEDVPNLQGIAVSDCVVTWCKAQDEALDVLLRFLGMLHVKMLDGGYLMQTTVSQGPFSYKKRIELSNLQKGMMYGGAYLDAFRHNHEVEVGSITLVGQESEPEFERWAPVNRQRIKPAFREGRRMQGQWEFYWATDEQGIEELKRARKDSYSARFAHLLETYRSHKDRRESVRSPDELF